MDKVKLYLLLLTIMFASVQAGAEDVDQRIVKGISAEGSCAVVGMSSEQSQLMALQRARVSAIEQAAGVRISSSTVVTNDRLAVDFIRTYSKGYIINEKVEWLPMDQYQKDRSSPPIPEYRVRITADVYKPERKIAPLGLKAEMNGNVFRSGEEGRITVRAERKAKMAIFNITADDKVVMVFPNQYEKDNVIADHESFVFPAKDSPIALVFRTVEGHKKDAEAFLVVAMDNGHSREFVNMFRPLEPMGFSEFFSKYAEIADYCEDKLLTYEVSE